MPHFGAAFSLVVLAAAAGGAPAVEKSAGGSAPGEDAEALALFSKACDLGDARGCSRAAWLIASGRGGSIGRARAYSFEQRGCELGSAWSCDRSALWRLSERYLALGTGTVQALLLLGLFFVANRKIADTCKRRLLKIVLPWSLVAVTWGIALLYFFTEMMTGRWATMQISVSTAICLAFLFLPRLRFRVAGGDEPATGKPR